MSSDSSSDPQAGGIAAHVARQTAGKPPLPKGRGVVLALLAAAVLIAVIVQFATGTGPAAHVGKGIEERKRERPVAPPEPSTAPEAPAPDPGGAPGRRPELVPEDGASPAPFPIKAPGANLTVPEGLSDRTAGRLRLSLAGLREANIIAVSAVKDLAAMVEEASFEDAVILRPFVIEKLATVAGSPRLGSWALDAGLVLATNDATGLAPLAVAARNPGLEEDATTPAAILFLAALGADEQEASVAAVTELLQDDARPVHLRVLAARALVGWDVVPKDTAKLPAAARAAFEED